MSKSSTQATRFAIVTFFTIALTIALAITFAPLAFAQGSDADCRASSLSDEICDALNTGGNTAPAPRPTPPPRNYAGEHNHALSQAYADLDAQLQGITPAWEVWPPADANQIVFLPSFLAITDAGWVEVEGEGAAGPNPPTRVTVTAEPKRTRWTLTETVRGTVYEFVCDGQGSPWSPGADPIPDCGWTPENTTDLTGPIALEVVIEYDLTWYSTYRGNSPGVVGTFTSDPATGTLTVSEVQTIGSTDITSGRGGNATVTAPEGDDIGNTDETGGNNDGTNNNGARGGFDNGFGDASAEPADSLPVRSIACSVQVTAEAHVIVGPELSFTVNFIVEEFADGTRVVTAAVESGAGVGVGASVGAYATLGDFSVGAFAKAEAEIWAAIGTGKEWVIGPDEDYEARLSDIVGGLLLDDINPVPTGILGAIGFDASVTPEHDAQFFEFKAWIEAGGSAQAGRGLIGASAGIEANAGVAERVRVSGDGYSLITTYTGEFNVGLRGESLFSDPVGIEGSAAGAISIETIYEGREAVELVLTRTYSLDGDAGDLADGNDTPTQTTQQWRLDLTNPAVADALLTIDETFGPTADLLNGVPGANEYLVAQALIDQYGTTNGPLTQNVTTTNTPAGIGAGLGADFEFTGNSGCVELS